VSEETSGEDAERGGRDARAPQDQKHLRTVANLAQLLHNLEKAKGQMLNAKVIFSAGADFSF